ncbi:hypothetical protein TRVL_05458 [Trypanosoma vivax]|nr:hypothetical protein TRVL_05458 [Trypanosoma vivax]
MRRKTYNASNGQRKRRQVRVVVARCPQHGVVVRSCSSYLSRPASHSRVPDIAVHADPGAPPRSCTTNVETKIGWLFVALVERRRGCASLVSVRSIRCAAPACPQTGIASAALAQHGLARHSVSELAAEENTRHQASADRGGRRAQVVADLPSQRHPHRSSPQGHTAPSEVKG